MFSVLEPMSYMKLLNKLKFTHFINKHYENSYKILVGKTSEQTTLIYEYVGG